MDVQRALRPQARFGGQPPQAAFGPEMTALLRDNLQVCNTKSKCSNLSYARRGRRPYNKFVGSLYILNEKSD